MDEHAAGIARRVAVAAAIALAAAPAAQAKTLRLNWVERTGPEYGYPAMTFTVESITVEGTRWSMRASVANRSKHVVTVTRGKPGNGDFRFGLIVPYQGKSCSITGTCLPTLLGSQQSRPPFPSSLGPGRTWSGSFAGAGRLPRGQFLNVAFGFFVDSTSKKAFSWITQHSFKL